MSDEKYAQKLESLQQFIPFLDNMIQQLKDPMKKNREQQLAKLQSLHAMITDKKKKLKYETLTRCEDVISKLYEKVHNRPIGAKRSMDSPLLTPASPSPPREINPTTPLNIPTERLDSDRPKVKIDIYSSAAESLNKPKLCDSITINTRVPDMSKPPISLEDLKTLEEDVQDKINESSLKKASLSELNDLREMINEQIQMEEKKTISPQKTKKDGDINTTVRNNTSLTKIAIQSPDKSKIKEKNTESPKSSSNQKIKELKPESEPETKKEVKSGPQNVKSKSAKILKEPDSIFGSILSNIDDQILGGSKKKEERRNSIPGKDERRLSDGGKEKSSKSTDKAPKKEERRSSSSGKHEKKSEKKPEKNGASEKNKNLSNESSNKEKYFSLSGKQSLEEKEQELKEKLIHKLSERQKNEAQKDDQKDPKGEIENNIKQTEETKDIPVLSKISVKKDLELKPCVVPPEDKEDANKTPVFKRLADKYNPKPRKQNMDADVDRVVAASIEANMKTSPPKIPTINKMPEPVPPPPSLVMCSQSEPELPQTSTQLPAVLQNILNPSTTHLINSVVNQLRQSNAENEARKSPLVTNPKPPLLANAPSLLGNPPSLLVNHPTTMGSVTPLIGNSPSLGGNANLMSPPVLEDNFVSDYCRETFNLDDNVFNKQGIDFTGNRFTPPARPESRMRFEQPLPPEMMGNQLPAPQNTRYVPGMGERFNEGYMPNRQFPTHQPMAEMYPQSFNYPQNQVDIQPLDYYPPNAPIPSNQYNCGPPLLSPEVPHFHNEQKPGGFGMVMNNDFFGHNEDGGHWRANEDRFHWDRQDARVNRDPRTYREYREMREARDPRMQRDNRDPRESRDSRDPRINRDPRDRDRDRDYRDPRLNRSRDSRDRERERSMHRDSRPQSRDYRPSRYDSKFDRVYSRTNRDRSRSKSRVGDTFTSPLDSLYSGKDEHRTGKGYGVQNFRIPKIKKEDETKEKEEEYAKVSSTNEDLVEAVGADTENNDACDSEVEQDAPPELNEPHSQDEVEPKKVETKDTEQNVSVCEPVKEVLPQAPEPPKLTTPEPVEQESRPDQTILVQFFANLLGSQNKRDKKTALYSLISTFSDTFKEKELTKITKIMKAYDDDEDSSEEEEEPKKVVQKPEEEKEAHKEEAPEEAEKEDDVEAPKPKPRRRIMRISSSSPSKEEKNETEPPTASSQRLESEEKEEGGVIVSVGERIKSRKRQSASPKKPKKKCRTELDMLHEDIQDMFIRDGVLTASGKRMCRILKGDPNVLSAVQQPKDMSEEPTKPRRKPMPKCKQKGPNAAEVKVMKSVRVVIPKIPDKNSSQKDDAPRRNLRRSVRNVAYAESDEESPVHEETPTVNEESLLEDEPLREMDSDLESSDSDKEKSSQPADNQKSKMGKRKRGKGWASGVLPSNKKKRKKQASFDESDETSVNKESEKSLASTTESDADKSYVEPDKNYYIDMRTTKSHHCKLCSYQGRFITTHYKLSHPLSEILTSRFSPSIAEEAIKDCEKNLAKYQSLLRKRGGGKIQFTCRFCEFKTHSPPTVFYDHITTHTGEYRHICPMCEFSASSGKTLKSHMSNSHDNEGGRIVRKSYSQTIMFGYMCGECHYVQLNKTNVEEHINIFHLQKPTIYTINMSTYLDPEVEKLATKGEEVREEVDEPPVEENVTEEIQQKAQAVENPVEEKIMPPPQRKKPGPKPGAKKKKNERKKMTDETVESENTTDSESVTSNDSDSRIENKEAVREKPAAVSKRRLTREISLEEDVSPIRSRRAAKDKAAEKLKTLMEATEGLPRKKSLTGDDAKKHEEKKKETANIKPTEVTLPEQPENGDNGNKDINNTVNEVSNIKKEEKSTLENKPKDVVRAVVKKEVEMNVFTCKTDLQEENKKIEQERLQLMDELNKSMGSRTSLNFVDKLCNRLNQGEVVIKQELHDEHVEGSSNRDTNNESPLVMPVLHKENILATPTTSVVPSTSTQMTTPNKKPVFEPEPTRIAQSSFDVVQKNDKINDMIQKLKGKLASYVTEYVKSSPITVEDNDYDSEGPPPLTHVNELVNVKPADRSTKTLLIGGFIKVIRSKETLMFSCLVPPCAFSTEDKDAFQTHCKEVHKQSGWNGPSTLCELCGTEVVTTEDYTLLENLFRHVIADHADFSNNEPEREEGSAKAPTRVRIRKLSGDALSVIKNDWDEVIPVVAPDDDVEASAAKADKEETDKENQNSSNGASTSSMECTPPDDPPATMVELNMSEDNPFPFKISGVMSLAEQQPQLPPLAPIALKPSLLGSLTTGSQLIVKEAKLSQAELLKPRKTAKAMAKFISSVSDLYKCPHYYCLFSTNFRDFLERHLKAHKVEQDIMIPCVYCDMKTPWEHVPMHIDIRHAHCRFACSFCLYRAVAKEYVFLHQDREHPASDYSVIALPQPKHSKKFAIADMKVDPKSLCEPYRCLKGCNVEFLYENEFDRHLLQVHKKSFILCGYKNCMNRVHTTKMSNHWAIMHGVCVYQCGVCKTGANELVTMYHHFSRFHPGLQPDILIRVLTPMQEGVVLGYSNEALKMMRKVVTIPTRLLEQAKQDNAKLRIKTGSQTVTQKPAITPKLQIVSSLQQTVNTGVMTLPPNAAGIKVDRSFEFQDRTITFVSTDSTTTGATNILLLPSVSGSNSLGTIVMATQPQLVTTMAPSSSASVNVVPSIEPIPSTSISSGDVTAPPAPPEPANTITSVDNTQENQSAIAPLEHITVGDDNQMAVEDGDNGDVDPLSLDGDLTDTAKVADADSSGDESDGSKMEKSKKQTKSGLLSYQLYRCAFCDISFSNSNDFKKHATKSLSCRRPEGTGKQFVCVHCDRKLRNAHVLGEHIQCHGVWRFSCSLCCNKYPTANQARSHAKTRHNINQTILTPVNPNKTNPDTDEYVVRPKLAIQPLPASEATLSEPSTSASSSENVYTPDQIDKIPMRHILSASIRCGLCSYNTKVRTNMVRHLQFHLEEKAVSESAPVNPVPCLEKNEKMFDKMINLASSSHATSRMGGGKDGKEKEVENLPEFVSTHCRYVCPAQGCNYLCPEEGNLRHHILALHANETLFTCLHCKANLPQTDPDNLIKHFKLHGRQLYRCHHCGFLHHFKHKVEKHSADVHLDLPVKVITVRCLESEPVDQEPSTSGTQALPPAPPAKVNKPWRCCMCKYKSGSQEGIQQHVLEKHEFDSQFKCALCTYKNNDKDSFSEHFKETHDNQTVDIIYAYRLMEDKEKENISFDTTPLWQRDRPRVRHIRGILFDESTPVVQKSPKKTTKNLSSPGPSGVKATTPPAPSTSKNTSVDLSIESVVNGTATILHDKPSSTIADDFVELVNKYAKDSGDNVEDKPEEKNDIDDDVIVIEDDDEKDAAPLAKNKDNKNAPVAKNRPSKRKTADVVMSGKVAKVSDEVIIDLESANGDIEDQDEFSERSLILRFANFGTPLNKQLKCPVCNQFKSKRISDFIFHMFKEMKVYRFKCKICADESITYRYMYRHVQDHSQADKSHNSIIFLPPNEKLEAWLQMVIREQSLIILQNFSPTPDDNVPSSKKLIPCPHCNRTYQTEAERNEHSIIHWSLKPYCCRKCKFAAYNSNDVIKHLISAHKDTETRAEQYVVSTAPTISKELRLSDNAHMNEVNSVHAEKVKEKEKVAPVEKDPLRITESEAPPSGDTVVPPSDNSQKPNEEEGELRESDLVIVTKTDSNVPNENDVFCCEYCPFMTNSETYVLRHITSIHEHMHIRFKTLNKVTCEEKIADYVGCMLCPELGSEIHIRQHHLDVHEGQTFVMYRYTCQKCNKRFLRVSGMKLHFKKMHPGFPLSYTGLGLVDPVENPVPEKQAKPPSVQNSSSQAPYKVKTYNCPLCPYERIFRPNSVNNVRAHVKQHFKAFACGLCLTHKFKTRWEAMSHFLKEHRGQPENIILDPKVNEAYNEVMAQIMRDAKFVTEGKNTARKSTSAPARPAAVEYSFYGSKPEPVDLSKITTAVEINGMTLNMTADRLGNIFDLNARVVVEDCNLPVNLSLLFDS